MFNVFKKILGSGKITEEDAKKVQPFILLRWLSGDPRLIPLALQLNQLKTLPNNLILLQAMQDALKGKVKFIKYPSSSKADSKGLEAQDNIQRISKYFDVGSKEAEAYYEWMIHKCPNELQQLKNIFKISQ